MHRRLFIKNLFVLFGSFSLFPRDLITPKPKLPEPKEIEFTIETVKIQATGRKLRGRWTEVIEAPIFYAPNMPDDDLNTIHPDLIERCINA